MCRDFYDLSQTAERCGWYGWNEGSSHDGHFVFKCGCDDEHTSFVSNSVDEDPDYYELRCKEILTCQT